MAETQTLNLYQKLAKIRKQVEVIQKNKSGFNYKYVTEDELYAKITGLMDKYSLSLIPGIVPGTMNHEVITIPKVKVNKDTKEIYEEKNTEVIVSADTTFTWLNNDNPDEKIVIPWGLIGQQADSSQAFGSGLTYGSRYFLLKYFNVSTPDSDPDNWRSKQKAAELAEDKTIAEQIIKELDVIAKEYLANHKDKKDAVKTLASKYVKDGNYFVITDSTLAAKLLSEFKDTFLKEEK